MTKKATNSDSDLGRVGFKSKMASVVEVDLGSGIIALERFGTWGQEKRVVFAPNGQQRWLFRPEVFLELRIKRYVTGIVQEQIQLNFVIAGSSQKGRVERVGFRCDDSFILNAVDILPYGRFWCEKLAESGPVFCIRLFPVFLDRVPSFTQTGLIGIAILRNDRGDLVRVSEGEPETYGCAIVEDVNREPVEADWFE